MAVHAQPVVQQVAATVLNSCYGLVDKTIECVCTAIERLEPIALGKSGARNASATSDTDAIGKWETCGTAEA